MTNIYIVKHDYDDEAHFFESEETLAKVLEKERKDVPYLELDILKFWVIENTTWNSNEMKEFRRQHLQIQYPNKNSVMTTWRGKYRLWKGYERHVGLCDEREGNQWLCEHAKQIQLEAELCRTSIS